MAFSSHQVKDIVQQKDVDKMKALSEKIAEKANPSIIRRTRYSSWLYAGETGCMGGFIPMVLMRWDPPNLKARSISESSALTASLEINRLTCNSRVFSRLFAKVH